ncbi:hypothetical protein BDV93DRAFT_515123 [Ceratobasidium sp. AG-I]|nr:hypothetical protein BDV93DRAFT_515123 [Ceratobasidium sp. AG-I]
MRVRVRVRDWQFGAGFPRAGAGNAGITRPTSLIGHGILNNMEEPKDLVPGEPETYAYERLRYHASQKYLLRLGASDKERKRFQELHADDIQGLVQLLNRKRELGQTNAALPWFWKVSFTDGEDIKVEWFLARERYRQWDEEILWLNQEVASTVLTFKHHQRNWNRRADEAFQRTKLGYWSYCNRKARLWRTLRVDTAGRGRQMLEYVVDRRNLDICLRVIRELSHA